MMHDFETYKKRHSDFWRLTEVKGPLIGFTIGAGLDSWSYWQYNQAAQALLKREIIHAQDINPGHFVEDQRNYLQFSGEIEDDVCRTAIPLPSIPWMEAILGCPVISTGSSVKSREIIADASSYACKSFDPGNPWAQKYLQFIQTYKRAFKNQFPIGQSVIRGPSDLACALMGAEAATLALVTEKSAMQRLLDDITDHLESFLRWQLDYIPPFQDGFVIGQYEIWAPEPAIRIQEDYSVLYSPGLYEEFLLHLDERLAAIAPFTLMHLHASSIFLIESFLKLTAVNAFQVSKDAGVINIQEMMPGLQAIQRAGKPLVLKGQFSKADLQQIRKNLSPAGLCLQPVVKDIHEAQKMLPALRAW